MNLRLKMSTVFVIVACLQTVQLKTQDQYNQAKEFIQEKIRTTRHDYPIEYQAAQEGAAYGALAGAVKSFIPLVPKNGKGLIGCMLIGAVVGACANVGVKRNPAPFLKIKNNVEYVFLQKDDKDLQLKIAQMALKSLEKTPEETKKSANSVKQPQATVVVITEAEKAAQQAVTNKAILSQHTTLIKAGIIGLAFIFA